MPLRVAGSLKDIHDEKKTSLSLGDAMTRFEVINKASSIGLWDMTVVAGDPVNPKNEFWWSDQFRGMLGFRDESDFPNLGLKALRDRGGHTFAQDQESSAVWGMPSSAIAEGAALDVIELQEIPRTLVHSLAQSRTERPPLS